MHAMNSLPSTYAESEQQASAAAFHAAYPSYAAIASPDELRASEYARLDAQQQLYLDYTGGGLYAESQFRRHLEFLNGQVLGDPHSHNPTSLAMTHWVEQARSYVFTFFRAPPDEYVVIDDQRVAELAYDAGISVRTGCFCNPGAGEIAHGLSEAEMRDIFDQGRPISFAELYEQMQARGRGLSAIRVSTGIATNFADVYRFLRFAAGFRDLTRAEVGGSRLYL